ncbi:HEPN domain-containing protein [Methylogaea oryzae]|uniref:HEPN domain-containing protein n=1 Tax=Methylogaea oryzae TaxID=1295382 RepID=UPI00278C5172|nr:HEPN domain-containing protein [Methylogaea oryzae]
MTTLARFGWKKIDRLSCRQQNSTFLLLDLRPQSGLAKILDRQSHRSYFESTYEVGYVLYSQSHFKNTQTFLEIELFSPTITTWIGNTFKRDEIIAHYTDRKAFLRNKKTSLRELEIRINNLGYLFIDYNPSIFYSLPECKAGIKFPPSLILRAENALSANNAISLINDLIVLLSLLTGDEIELETVYANHADHGPHTQISIYFPTAHLKRRPNTPILFPLGRNLRHNPSNLPALPLETFRAYFAENNEHKHIFEKYIRYRRRTNTEERFLGYFRLLEALTKTKKAYLDEEKLHNLCTRAKPILIKHFGDKKSVSAFLHNIPKYNHSKYNTEKCLRDFFDTIPTSITNTWIYDKRILKSICDLRNDLSHANNHSLDSSTIAEFTVLTETLLTIALLRKLEVPIESATLVISRMTGYFSITNKAQPSCY